MKLTKQQRFKLAQYADADGTLLPAARQVVDEVRWHDEAQSLAKHVSFLCEEHHFALHAVLSDPKATRVFLTNLRRCLEQLSHVRKEHPNE